ncbi:hypothetical protein ABGB12_12750 [Actinocorallia sp. B10E7]|uniref:hypothetical protein n=1 Tax=Actinocorallia sp. B10E7 TaxID=3153558 RepID=UPI00325D1D13
MFRGTNQGGDAVLTMGFELDQGEPVARRLEDGPGGPPRFGDLQFGFDLIVDGKPTSQLVGNGAKPFQVTGEGTRQKYQNVYYGWPFGGHSGVSLEALDGGHWIEEKDTYLLEEGIEGCT